MAQRTQWAQNPQSADFSQVLGGGQTQARPGTDWQKLAGQMGATMGTGPDGHTYEINAPEGATEQDAIAYAQASLGNPPGSVGVPGSGCLRSVSAVAPRQGWRSVEVPVRLVEPVR